MKYASEKLVKEVAIAKTEEPKPKGLSRRIQSARPWTIQITPFTC
jgi:hypothetical protein